jgi:replicative DNA helicase
MLTEIKDYLIKKQLETKEGVGSESILKICPFCLDDRWHFYINEEGLFHCKKCDERGNFRKFQKQVGEEPSIRNANEYLQTNIKTEDIKGTVEFLHQNLLENEKIQEYLISRGISVDSIEKYKLGYNQDWISIPHYYQNEPVSIKYRRLSVKEFKRLVGTPSILFNLDNVDLNLDEVIITEGEFDAIKGSQEGIKNLIGITVGADTFLDAWIPLLEKYKKIYIVFDSDAVGQRGAQKAAEKLGLDRCYNIILPDKDLNDFLLKHTAKEFEEYKSKAKRFEIAEITSLAANIDRLDEWLENRSEIRGLKTGYTELDNILWGLKNEDLIILSGASTTGKTTFLLNTINAMLKDRKKILAFMLEGRVFYFIERLMTIEYNKPIHEITKEEIEAFKTQFREYELYFYSGPQSMLDVDKVVEKAIICKNLYDVDLMVLDHLHVIVERGRDNYSSLVGRTVSSLKNLAIDLKIPVVVVCHIRKVQKNIVPSMQDLRDSSFIHQDADVVLMLWSDLDKISDRDNVVLKVLKNKTGLDGKDVFFNFNRSTGKFDLIQSEE